MEKTTITGSIAANPHEGSRSEILADYLFSGWGTVTPVRRQDDAGTDLYCTLTERVGQRAVVADYYTVQVKSAEKQWVLEGAQSVKWLLDYLSPLFLARVDKKQGVLCIHHLMVRFYLAALGSQPNRLTLRLEDIEEGAVPRWEDGENFSLSAPIIRVTLSDLMDEGKLLSLRDLFKQWLNFERGNIDLVRNGLLRFRMPDTYKVNQPLSGSLFEIGYSNPGPQLIKRAIVAAAEAAECIGGQLGKSEDRAGALMAALFVDYLQKNYKDPFLPHLRWGRRLPADLGSIVCRGLNSAMLTKPTSLYQGIDTVEKMILDDPLVRRYLKSGEESSGSVAPAPPSLP